MVSLKQFLKSNKGSVTFTSLFTFILPVVVIALFILFMVKEGCWQ